MIGFFDIVLMIDVIEHIERHEQFTAMLNKYTTNIAYNIPIEINLFDVLRNFAMRKRLMPWVGLHTSFKGRRSALRNRNDTRHHVYQFHAAGYRGLLLRIPR
ncbi:MAG: hypothetical protein NTX75_09440 [Proteobacteria bacterium]|nr:hypothetical protein [Pseudomonadota bacterium]